MPRKRPWSGPKKQRRCYSGKKKRHTVKTQVVVDKITAKIICTHTTTKGRVHDKKLLACSRVHMKKDTKAVTDSGYQGLQKEHANTAMPAKNTKLHPLTGEQKKANRVLSQERILVENVIGSLKRFRILAERYRNRRHRFGLRFNLIAAIHNMELGDAS